MISREGMLNKTCWCCTLSAFTSKNGTLENFILASFQLCCEQPSAHYNFFWNIKSKSAFAFSIVTQHWKQRSFHIVQLRPWLLMDCWHKEPGNQHPWYWCKYTCIVECSGCNTIMFIVVDFDFFRLHYIHCIQLNFLFLYLMKFVL